MDESVREEDVRIHVSARIRPTQSTTQSCIYVNEERSSIYLRNTDNEQKEFEFDNVLGADISQAEVFEKIGKDIVNGCLEGYNGTVLAYGQTNSGKTFTMQGNDFEDENYEDSKGIMPRAVEYLFKELESKKDNSTQNFNFQVHCSFIELYGEQIFDLLDPKKQPKLRLNGRRAQLENTRVEIAYDSEDVLELLKIGIGNRRVEETRANRQSSRSHSILVLHIATEEYQSNSNESLGEDSVLVRKSAQLNFVDLAGSERLSYSKTERQRMKEAIHINKSLTTLGRVMRSLSKKWNHVPYRDSILTQFLAHSLNSRTVFIITLHPDKRQFDTTASSLQFAQTLRTIKHKVWMNQESVPCNNTTNNLNSHILSPLKEVENTSLAFESIEQLTQTLDQIEQQKKAFVSSFNQLSVREAEISQKLNAYKNATTDSVFLGESYIDQLDANFSGRSVRKGNRSIASSIVSSSSKNRRSNRRRTIFALSSDLPTYFSDNSPFHQSVIDFQGNSTIVLDQSEIDQNTSNEISVVSILKTPKSQNSTKNESTGKDVSLLKTPSPLKGGYEELVKQIEKNKENYSKIPVKSAKNVPKFGAFQFNIDDIIRPSRILESQAISQTPNNPTKSNISIDSIEESGDEPDPLSNKLITLDEDDSAVNALQKSIEQLENSSREFSTSSNEENNERVDKIARLPKFTKYTPMILRRKSMARLRLANQVRSKRRTMSLEKREVIVNTISEFKDEIFNYGTTQVRRKQIWAEICEIYSTKCPNQEKIGVQRMRQIWGNLRRRALKLSSDPNKEDKMTCVDHLVLSIIEEADANRQRTSSIPKKDQMLYTQLLLKQGKFVQKMVELKLIPVFTGSKVTYRQMSAKEMENPQIELPKEFLPTEEMLSSLKENKEP